MSIVYQTHYKDIQPLFQKASVKKELPTDVQAHSLMWSMVSNSPKYSLDTMDLYDQPATIKDDVVHVQHIVDKIGKEGKGYAQYALQSLNNMYAPLQACAFIALIDAGQLNGL